MPETTDAPAPGRARREGASSITVLVLVALAGAVGTGVVHGLSDAVAASGAAAVLAATTVGAAAIGLGGRRAARTDDAADLSRERYYWPLIWAVVALLGAGGAAIVLGVARIRDPFDPTEPELAAIATAASALLLVVTLQFVLRRSRDARAETRLGAFLRRAHRPDLPIALVLAFGAIGATVLATAGAALTVATDEATGDGAGAIGAGAAALITALVLVVEVRSLLVSRAPTTRDVEAVRAAIEVEPVVLAVHDLRVVRLGPDQLLVATRVELLGGLDVGEVSAAIDRVGRNVRTAVPTITAMFVEPEIDPTQRHDDTFVPDLVGHIDPGDPDYASITGQHPVVDVDDDIWS